jgi:DNA-binding IclR family transcriptional regulator
MPVRIRSKSPRNASIRSSVIARTGETIHLTVPAQVVLLHKIESTKMVRTRSDRRSRCDRQTVASGR